MNYFDLFVLIIFAFAIIKGLQKGFVIELASLVGLILGIVGAIYLSGTTAEWLSAFITSKYISIIAFLLIMVGIIILVFLLAKMVETMVKALALGWLNRIMGAFFALVKSAFSISLLIFIIEFSGYGLKVIPPDTRDTSYTFKSLEWFAPATFTMLQLNYEHLLPSYREPQAPPPPVIV